MKRILTLATLVVLAMACSNGPSAENGSDENVRQLTIEELNSSAAELNDETVTVSGMVFHVCKHGGQKMFIKSASSDLNVLIRVSQSIPEFDVALEGSNVEVTGKLVVTAADTEEMEHKGGEGGEEAMHATSSGEPEECTTEEQMKAQEMETGKGISYHIEATSFKEVI